MLTMQWKGVDYDWLQRAKIRLRVVDMLTSDEATFPSDISFLLFSAVFRHVRRPHSIELDFPVGQFRVCCTAVSYPAIPFTQRSINHRDFGVRICYTATVKLLYGINVRGLMPT